MPKLEEKMSMADASGLIRKEKANSALLGLRRTRMLFLQARAAAGSCD